MEEACPPCHMHRGTARQHDTSLVTLTLTSLAEWYLPGNSMSNIAIFSFPFTHPSHYKRVSKSSGIKLHFLERKYQRIFGHTLKASL